ncbi:tankyrase-1 [Caerostris extrusa]|uniref:Alpha-latrotoxin n=1 Tax=Caerostris extrusa TaxID=172846 RepID=A0AAV4NUI4_CAEEX|nr:tankyrase-1 [Caerostris extrusa]
MKQIQQKKTCEGETLLHLATSKGYKEAAELLIKYTSHDKLSKLINATTKNGDTPLHIAARHGFTAISKSLLKYGATYCLKNKERKVPLDLAIKHINVKHLLQITHCCFEYAASNSSELNHILQSMKPDERLAVTNATNESGQTLLALIKSKHYQIISNELLETMNKYSRITLCRPLKTPEIRRRIYKAINAFLEYSEILLKQLALMSYCASEKNMSPRSTLKEGLLYLINAYRFVEEYKSCFGVVNNYQFQKIEETLKDLQFCPDDIRFGYTDEAYDEKMKSFIIDNKEAVYYKLLHSELTKDIRQFFYIVEKGIQVQVVDIFDNIEGFSFRVEFI